MSGAPPRRPPRSSGRSPAKQPGLNRKSDPHEMSSLLNSISADDLEHATGGSDSAGVHQSRRDADDDDGGAHGTARPTTAPPSRHPHGMHTFLDTKPQSLLSIPTGPRKSNAHHRHKSSISQLFDSFSGSLGTIGENLVTEGKVVQDTWHHELDDANHGRVFILDMALTRSMSVLPEELPDLAQAATGVDLHGPAPADASSVGRYLSLLGAVMAVSSNGAALALLHGVHPALKLYWRMTATAAALSLFAARSIQVDGWPKLTVAQCVTFGQAIFCFALHTLLYYSALEYTSIGNAVIGSNSQALLIILGKFLVGEHVLLLEGGGVLLAFFGCVLCAQDEARAETASPLASESGTTAMWGSAMALGSAAFGVGYLTFAKAVRPHVPVIVFMFLVMSLGSLLVLLYLLIIGHPMRLSNDPYVGMFGWLNLFDHRLWIMIHIAIICNVFGAMGFVRAMQYFDNLVIAVATLLEPMTATLIAFALHVGELPGPVGWLGNALVVIGTLCVVYPSMDTPMEH